MDNVPFAFSELLIARLYAYGRSQAKKLSGSYGKLARRALEHNARYVCELKRGVQVREYVESTHNLQRVQTTGEINAVVKKFVRGVWISLDDAEYENVLREIVQRFPYSHHNFILTSSSIDKAWVDFACSLKTLQCVSIMKQLDDNALRLFQKIIMGKKLTKLWMHPDACEGSTMEIPKSLLCQEQFEKLFIQMIQWGSWKTAPVRELLQLWSENSERVRGKYLTLETNCRSGIEQLEEFLIGRKQSVGIENVLQICSKDECDLINKEYLHNHFVFSTPSCVYKYEEEEGVIRGPRLYISFECAHDFPSIENIPKRQNRPAIYDGHNDLRLMRDTRFFRILFA
uniref:F-box domain-containing protein n=1 Tax=Steinernema glaseri TaxID=37863 RepID=A0A1I7ZQ38_9BILA